MGCFGSDPKKPEFKAAQYTEAELSALKTAFEKFNEQGDQFEKTQGTIKKSASGYLDALESLRPGYKAGIDKAQQTADSLAQGLPPADVAQRISRGAAFKGLTAGLGQNQRATLEARDYGQTSLDLMGKGLGMQQQLRAETMGYMPMQALNLAFTPQQIRAEDNQINLYNNQIKNRQAEANANVYNQQQQSNYQYDQQYGGNSFLGAAGGLLGGAVGAGIGAMTGGPMGALTGAGMGMNFGGGLGGQLGGAQGAGMGQVFQGAGNMMSTFGGLDMGGFFNSQAQPQMRFNPSVGLRGVY